MKTIFWFILSTLIAIYSANAQTMQLGLRVGGNLTSATLQPTDGIGAILASGGIIGSQVKLRSVSGYHAGVVMNIAGSNGFSLQPEVLYSQCGVRYDGGPNSAGRINSAEVTANTIDVPLLVKYTFSGRSVRFFINTGPYVNYSLNGKLTIKIDYFDQSEAVRFDPNSTRFGYGLTGGTGFICPVGPGNLLVEARYNYALRSRISQFNDANDHTQVGMVSVGYLLPLSKRN